MLEQEKLRKDTEAYEVKLQFISMKQQEIEMERKLRRMKSVEHMLKKQKQAS